MKFEPCVMIGRWIDISGFIVQSDTGIYRLIIIKVCRTKVGNIKEYTVTGIYRLIIINVCRTKVGGYRGIYSGRYIQTHYNQGV